MPHIDPDFLTLSTYIPMYPFLIQELASQETDQDKLDLLALAYLGQRETDSIAILHRRQRETDPIALLDIRQSWREDRYDRPADLMPRVLPYLEDRSYTWQIFSYMSNLAGRPYRAELLPLEFWYTLRETDLLRGPTPACPALVGFLWATRPSPSCWSTPDSLRLYLRELVRNGDVEGTRSFLYSSMYDRQTLPYPELHPRGGERRLPRNMFHNMGPPPLLDDNLIGPIIPPIPGEYNYVRPNEPNEPNELLEELLNRTEDS